MVPYQRMISKFRKNDIKVLEESYQSLRRGIFWHVAESYHFVMKIQQHALMKLMNSGCG